MSTKQILSRFRYLKRKLALVESDFDMFVRRNANNPEARKAKMEEANRSYFAIKAEMQGLRELFAIAKGNQFSEITKQ